MKQICFFLIFSLINLVANAQQDSIARKSLLKKDSSVYQPIRLISADYYTKQLGFFCKKELQVEKTTKLPLRFRLGNIEYTDMLEGKRRYLPAAQQPKR